MKTGNETTVREMDIIRSLIKRVKDGMLLLEGSLLQVEMPKPLARALGTIGTTKRIRRKKQQREAHLVTMTVGLDGMMRRTMDLITGIRVPQIRELLVTMGNQMPHGQKEASFKSNTVKDQAILGRVNIPKVHQVKSSISRIMQSG
ncbi:uncharacterized protein LOC130139027 isoform X2 [Syzygium oleosum]|uniref:uncharacterized protein LOC130139027 isoform X2 n=1 Tax=Syzygium oleosum TaxID=219896 RepID=UPI0024B8981F|nr:uncharacterized protein LOC130139027 isoform X2 [Syzygium oleosum]